jgi:hypothetical protein
MEAVMPDSDRTDPIARARRTVGDLDLQSAGLMDLGKSIATSGGAALLLYQLLTGQIQGIAADVDRLAERVEHMGADVTSLRGDVIRLQVQTSAGQALPRP